MDFWCLLPKLLEKRGIPLLKIPHALKVDVCFCFRRRGVGGVSDYRSTKSSRFRVQLDADDGDAGDGEADSSSAAASES